MVIHGPNARRDFHVDPSDEIFYMLRGDMVLEYIEGGRRHEQVIREGEIMLMPALTPHAPHRPAGTWGACGVRAGISMNSPPRTTRSWRRPQPKSTRLNSRH